jgi:HEAT repeat protein
MKRMLEAEEPNYALAATVGPEVVPHLETLANGPDESLAARAIAFASRTEDPRAAELVRRAATSSSVRIRIQAAHGARHLHEANATAVLTTLLDDPDAGVRSVAIKSVATAFAAGGLPPDLVSPLAHLAEHDPEPFIRELSTKTLT